MREITEHGKVRSRFMDFRVQNLTDRISKIVGAKAKSGAVISELRNRGSAQRAGLQVGDVITKVDNREVKSASDAEVFIFSQQVGARSELTIDRGGQDVKAIYEVTEPPKVRD